MFRIGGGYLVFLVISLWFLVSAVPDDLSAGEDDVDAQKGILESSNIEVSSEIGVYSKYIWRGFELDSDPVVQPAVYLSAYGFEASVWGNFDFDADDALNSDEVDYTIGYTYDLRPHIDLPVSVSGGLTYYDFPAADGASREFYVGLGFDTLLEPSFTWYHDFGDEDSGGGDGDYIIGELSYSHPFKNTPVSLDLSGHVGYNNELFIRGQGGDVGLTAGLTVTLYKNCTLTPNINYSIPFGDLKDADDGDQDNQFYGGVVLAYSF